MELRGGFVGFGNTPIALVHRRRERLGPPAAFNARTGAGYVSPKEGDCARAEAMGVRVILMLIETFGGRGPALVDELREEAEWRANKLLSVAVQYSVAQEVAEARGLSVAADPQAVP